MPRIQPFRAVRYTQEAGSASDLVAPPYDVIDVVHREELARRSPHNVVHVTLPQPPPGQSEDARYEAARATWRNWEAKGVVARDERPSVYVLTQRYRLPDGREVTRTGVLARMRLHRFSEKIVLPHEKTLVAPIEDRLKLTTAVRVQLEPIFLVFPDAGGRAREVLAAAAKSPAVVSVRTEDQTEQGLHVLTDPEALAALGAAVEPVRAVIADGHHRYQTALAYREREGEDVEGPHQWVLAFLCPLEDEGLVILPTHRLVHSLEGFDAEHFLGRAGEIFSVQELHVDAADSTGQRRVLEALAEAGRDRHAFAVVAPGGRAWLLTLPRGGAATMGATMPEAPEVRDLDVTVLHSVILQDLLGIDPEAQARKTHLEYFKKTDEAFARILGASGPREGQLLFLMNPTRMEQVRAVAEAGYKMPQKSTYFFPKVPSGLVFNPLYD
ncbi:MAG: DUF1015 domain-containing protein [Deltaproteobacteria bacterium]|nr:MAG: DUF1015 domain-containing protein [Deltaproteobacteria bacterium]